MTKLSHIIDTDAVYQAALRQHARAQLVEIYRGHSVDSGVDVNTMPADARWCYEFMRTPIAPPAATETPTGPR